MIAFAKPDNIIAMPQKSNEWYTPARYIEAAREVMGGIDLDPASCKEANMVVRAERFYTQQENGLEQPWYGRVYLNPPYSMANQKNHLGQWRSSIEGFTKRLIDEYENGNVEQAILCAIGKIDAQWFQPLWEYPICFSDHIVKFNGYKPKGQKTPLKQMWGTIFVYLGPHEQRFIDVFSKFGTIAKRVSQPRQQVIPLSLWEV
jgi:DNA N-6-adenine-methyltransferase (Dam)